MRFIDRNRQEKILIGDAIEIVVVRIESNRVRIGVIAPDDVPVLRGEIAGQKQGGNYKPSTSTRREPESLDPERSELGNPARVKDNLAGTAVRESLDVDLNTAGTEA